MAVRVTAAGTEIVGRDEELTALSAFLDGETTTRSLHLHGPPGVGKTTLWEAALTGATERKIRVLRARLSETESAFELGAVTDLLERVDLAKLADVPGPQLRALEIALLRIEPNGATVEGGAVSMGFASVFRTLAQEGPVLVAVDDVQWIDQGSAAMLAFAARRLESDDVRFLLTSRAASTSVTELLDASLSRIEVGPLSLGAIRHMLIERLELRLPRGLLHRLLEASLGNPLFALEIGRALAGRDGSSSGRELPLPDRLEGLIGPRVADLPIRLRTPLLAVALSDDLRVTQLAALVGQATLDDCIDAGLLRVEHDRLFASHPLLAAAARKRSRAGERRRLHLALADVVVGEERQARHLAEGTNKPDEVLAGRVEAAARHASQRGAVGDALMLAEYALALTPETSTRVGDRLVDLAAYASATGDEQRTLDTLRPHVGTFLQPTTNARARLLLIGINDGAANETEIREHLERAQEEAADDPALQARVMASAASISACSWVEAIADAEVLAQGALRAARLAGPDVARGVLWALAWTRILRGLSVDDLDADMPPSPSEDLWESLDRARAVRQLWRGELAEARRELTRLVQVADQLGQGSASLVLRLHLCELELRSGNWAAAERIVDEWDPADVAALAPAAERCRALLAAGRGDAGQVEAWAAASALQHTSARWHLLEANRARGMAALLARNPARATEILRATWVHTCDEGVDDPGAFPVAPDLVEALVELGELEEAAVVVERLAKLSKAQEHAWGLATTTRCRGLLSFSAGDVLGGTTALEEAAAAYEGLGLRFDRARSFLALGRGLRRSRKWGAARAALEAAAVAFDELESSGWADAARSELDRVGGRRPTPAGGLTPAELRAATLAAEGLSNKEIAQALVVGIATVEAHLSHAYAKLGVRSRSQLAARLRSNA